ncbi:MAG: preprotein translocase subunit Sec61beta [Candidatus Woesearchaeota archaeon]
MAKNNNIQMPSGMGGLTRYNVDDKSLIKLQPTHIIVFLLLVILLVALLHLFGNQIFGISHLMQ